MGGEKLGIDVGRGDTGGGEGRRCAAQQRGQIGRRAGACGEVISFPTLAALEWRRRRPVPSVKIRHIQPG
jgi:hypothetical protein